MKKAAIIISGIMAMTMVSCNKEDDAVAPEQPTPVNPGDPIVIDPIEEKCDGTAYIEEAEWLDGAEICPGEVVTLTVRAGYTPDSVSFIKVYRSYNGDETEYLVETNTHGSITRAGEELSEYYLYAALYKDDCVEHTERMRYTGYDFQAPMIGHEEHPVICEENGHSTILSLGFPGAAHIKWTQDYMEIPGETSEELVVTQPGVYDIKTSYEECPDYFQSAGGIEVVSATSIMPKVIEQGNSITVQNYADMEYVTLELIDASGERVQLNAETASFENVPSGTYTVRANFWGNDFYVGLGVFGRTSVCNQVSNPVQI